MQQGLWQRIRFVRWTLCLAIIGSVLTLFVVVKLQLVQRPQALGSPEPTLDDANLTINNFDYRDVEEGQTRWTLHAESARYYRDKQETHLSQINAMFFPEEGGQVELQGDQGVFHNNSKDMEVKGNVLVTHSDGYRMATDRLLYQRQTELIHTPTPVSMEGQGVTVKGVGMRLELGKGKLTILKRTETTIQRAVLFKGQPAKANAPPDLS